MEEDLQKQKGVLSEDAFNKRVESYRKAFVELQTTYVQFQRDLTERETEETGRILKQHARHPGRSRRARTLHRHLRGQRRVASSSIANPWTSPMS